MSIRLLALDTATSACTVALCVDSAVYRKHAVLPRHHNQHVLPMVSELLDQAGILLSDLSGIVFGQGPGSFTGVRIAVSLVQGLAFGADLPVIPLSTLQIIAQTAYRKRGLQKALVGWDARLGEVYWGGFCLNTLTGLMEPVIQEGLYSPGKVPLPSAESGQPVADPLWVGVGSAWRAYDEVLYHRCVDVVKQAYPDEYPCAEAALEIGLHRFREGQWCSALEAKPCYWRDKVATPKSDKA